MIGSTRETVDRKATRLTRSRSISWVDQRTATVEGDHDRYTIRKLADGIWSCTCPWGTYKSHVKPCSHVFAAALTAPTFAPL